MSILYLASTTTVSTSTKAAIRTVLSASIRVTPSMPPMYTHAMTTRPTTRTTSPPRSMLGSLPVSNMRMATWPTAASMETMNMV